MQKYVLTVIYNCLPLIECMCSYENLRIRPIVLLENFSGRDSQHDRLVQELVQKSLSMKGAVLLTSRERKPDWLRARTIHLHKPDTDALLGMLRDLNVCSCYLGRKAFFYCLTSTTAGAGAMYQGLVGS